MLSNVSKHLHSNGLCHCLGAPVPQQLVAIGCISAPPKQSFATWPGTIIGRKFVENIGVHVIHMAIQSKNISPVFAMQGTNALATIGRGIGIVRPVVKLIRAGIAWSQSVFVRLPQQVAQRTPDGGALARGSGGRGILGGKTAHRAIHDIT